MSNNAVMFISYKLVEGASAEEFLVASEKVHDEVLSKKKGFISWKVLVDSDTWIDLVTWETMEDAVSAGNDDDMSNPMYQKFCSLIDPNSLKMQTFSVEKSY